MAGDWIKMRADLFTHPKVVRISSALKADTLRTVGGLMSVWCLFDAHSIDGRMDGYTTETLDAHLRWPGFASAMIAVGWLAEDGGESGESLVLPEFEAHNGASAKRRAQDADRKKNVRNMSASQADEMRTREEKRREEEPPRSPPEGGAPVAKAAKRSEQIGLTAFLAACHEQGESAIPEDDAVFAYADRIGLPHEFVGLAWAWFKRKYANKRQAGVRGWRQTFRNAVEDNWPKYWYPDADGAFQLTSAGKQAQIASEAGEA